MKVSKAGNWITQLAKILGIEADENTSQAEFIDAVQSYSNADAEIEGAATSAEDAEEIQEDETENETSNEAEESNEEEESAEGADTSEEDEAEASEESEAAESNEEESAEESVVNEQVEDFQANVTVALAQRVAAIEAAHKAELSKMREDLEAQMKTLAAVKKAVLNGIAGSALSATIGEAPELEADGNETLIDAKMKTPTNGAKYS